VGEDDRIFQTTPRLKNHVPTANGRGRRGGPRRRAARALIWLAASAAIVALVSCYHSGYKRELVANTTMLSQLADKLNDYCKADFNLDGRRVSAEEMGEFSYAFAKARAWAAMEQPQAHERASYRAFMRLLDAYDTFVREAGEYRLTAARNPARVAALAREHDEVVRRADAVLAAIRGEH
jgi:hypothetical protein